MRKHVRSWESQVNKNNSGAKNHCARREYTARALWTNNVEHTVRCQQRGSPIWASVGGRPEHPKGFTWRSTSARQEDFHKGR